ncbi:MAG: hypothetical protein VKO39_06530 [Cyanobacteriota bacterium]|nr:hypothetical protein [Cyanobacteriota bacterium]
MTASDLREATGRGPTQNLPPLAARSTPPDATVSAGLATKIGSGDAASGKLLRPIPPGVSAVVLVVSPWRSSAVSPEGRLSAALTQWRHASPLRSSPAALLVHAGPLVQRPIGA